MKISVIIPVFNRAHCVGRAIESVLAQTSKADEVLIVDDGSSDDLLGVLKKYNKKIKLIRHSVNMGASAARNTGIRAASGDLIAFLDSDDVWVEEKIRLQMDFMAENDLLASCAGFYYQNPLVDGEVRKGVFRPYKKRLTKADLLWGCYVGPGSTLMVERQVLLALGGYDMSFPRYEDWDLLLRIFSTQPGGFGFVNMPLATIFRNPGFDTGAALVGLKRMREVHAKTVAVNRKERRLFLSAIAFNRASIEKADKKYIKMFFFLVVSVLVFPCNHQPLKMLVSNKKLTGS